MDNSSEKAAEKDEAYPGIAAVFEYWNRNAAFCKAMLGPHGDTSFILRVKELLRTKLFNKLSDWIPKEKIASLPVPRDCLVAFMSSANIGVLQHWFDLGQKQTPQEIALYVTRLIHHGPLGSSAIRGMVRSQHALQGTDRT
ncbi:TetR-like C-terminal domain-containing protein [Cohnella thermotolerans]|uniref:TetR-like C-terminal domain-containing protein n=1 Tax=Cohnella thermotolerans TaxID=329858 RepID=UPI0004227799|nr:TetR-like C-terminal domain-containing protein [Cohnella thermotolerans]